MASMFGSTDILDRIYGNASRDPLDEILGRPPRRPSQADEEEARSMAAQLLGGLGGGLRYAGETLSKGGRAVRGTASGLLDLLAGKPWEEQKWGGGLLNLLPFSDTLGLTPPEEEVTGKQLLQKTGLAAENPEGFWENAWATGAGLATDIATDPLTWMLTGGAGAAKSGIPRAMGKAGLLRDEAYARMAMKGWADKAGAIERRLAPGGTGDLLTGSRHGIKEATKRLAVQLASEGKPMATAAELAEPWGSIFRLRVPLTDYGVNIGTGPVARAMAPYLDIPGKVLGAAGAPIKRLFSSQAEEQSGRIGQTFGSGVWRASEEGGEKGVMEGRYLAQLAGRNPEFGGAGAVLPEGALPGETARAFLERAKSPSGEPLAAGGLPTPVSPESLFLKAEHDRLTAQALAAQNKFGAGPKEAYRGPVDWTHRQTEEDVADFIAGKSKTLMESGMGADEAREIALRVDPGGTVGINQLFRNPATKEALTRTAGIKIPGVSGAEDEAMAAYLAEKHGYPRTLDWVNPATGETEVKDPAVKMAGFLRDALTSRPKAFETGLYPHHPLADTEAYLAQAGRREGQLRTSTQILSAPGAVLPKSAEGATLRQMAKAMGVRPTEFAAEVGPRLRSDLNVLIPDFVKPVTPEEWGKAILDLKVHPEVESLITHTFEPITGSAPLKSFGKGYQTLQSMFKAGVLARPAYHVRNLVSGQGAGWIYGQTNIMDTLSGEAQRLMRSRLPPETPVGGIPPVAPGVPMPVAPAGMAAPIKTAAPYTVPPGMNAGEAFFRHFTPDAADVTGVTYPQIDAAVAELGNQSRGQLGQLAKDLGVVAGASDTKKSILFNIRERVAGRVGAIERNAWETGMGPGSPDALATQGIRQIGTDAADQARALGVNVPPGGGPPTSPPVGLTTGLPPSPVNPYLMDPAKYRPVVEELKSLGLSSDAQGVTDYLQRLMFTSGAYGSIGQATGESAIRGIPTTLPGMLEQLPGKEPSLWASIKNAVQTGSRNPAETRGSYGWSLKAKDPYPTSEFIPAKISDVLARKVENLNRIQPILALIRKGVLPQEAIARVLPSQVAYDPQYWTSFERWLSKWAMPFVKFPLGQGKFMARELMEKPGGGLASVIKATARLGSAPPGEAIPDYVAQTMSLGIPAGTSIPGIGDLGPTDPDVRRYLSGLGLMHESPLQFIEIGRAHV